MYSYLFDIDVIDVSFWKVTNWLLVDVIQSYMYKNRITAAATERTINVSAITAGPPQSVAEVPKDWYIRGYQAWLNHAVAGQLQRC